eukprot:g1967.t1
MGWSSWNHFGNNGSHCGGCRLGAEGLKAIADAMIASGLRDAGFTYVNQDGGWASHRDEATGHLVPDPYQFPQGIKPVADYLHSKGMKLGIYTDRGSSNCKGVQTGSDSHWATDAADFAAWGVDLVKDDSCGGETHGTVWEQYARMRDALNRTGRPMWYMITQIVDFDDGLDDMHCIGPPKGCTGSKCGKWGAFTVKPWVYEGKDPRQLANSFLAEYCNNKVPFGTTGKAEGFLSQLDSQALLSYDNLTSPGAYTDMDMMEIGNTDHGHTLTVAESRSQFATFAILTSPLVLGNDPRNISAAILEVLTNKEVVALNQDPLVSRAALIYQAPDPPSAWGPGRVSGAPRNGCGYDNCTSGQLGPGPPSPPNPPVAPPRIQLQAWAKPLADGSVGLVVFNRDSRPSAPLNLTLQALFGGGGGGLASIGRRRHLAALPGKVTVRDLWQHRMLDCHTGKPASLNTTTITITPPTTDASSRESDAPGAAAAAGQKRRRRAQKAGSSVVVSCDTQITVGSIGAHDSAALRVIPE